MENIISTLSEILHIPSPTGYTKEIISVIKDKFKDSGLFIRKSNKGALLISFSENPELILTGHIDTLGGMVKEIKTDGTLEITQLGHYPFNSFEGEYVTVRNFKGELFRGTFLLNNPAAHVNKDVSSAKRDGANMSVRLDEMITTADNVKAMGINTGDFVFYDVRFECTASGYVKSRFLDDKACAAIMIELIEECRKTGIGKNTGFFFSNYEEVGHGSCAGIPHSAKELLVLDMAVIGAGCNGKEDAVSICVKDSSGPYDFDMTSRLRTLAESDNISFVTDVYPYYGSDGSAALRGGYDVRTGLIGPGVSASHGVERTHIKGIEETYKLSKLYIENFGG